MQTKLISMTNRLQNTTLISNNIHKVKKHLESFKENMQLQDTTSFHKNWLSQIPLFKRHSYHNDMCICLWDVTSNNFLFAVDEKGIMGYDMSDFTNSGGIEFSLANFHPEHMNAVHLINQCSSEWLARHQNAPIERVVINLDALYRIKNGSYIHILQQIIPVEKDLAGNPFLFLSYVRDITHLKKQPSVSCIFVAPGEVKFNRYSFETKQLETVMPFTMGENKVLRLLSDGKYTKYIAEKLSLSRHTVDTHRRNMLAKTSCVDTTALIAYCRITGLL